MVELGCGTAYFSAWLARRGARPVAVDLTPAQLATARRCQEHFGLTFPLVEASADDVPLPDGSFDLVVSEYGASVWCDPERWLAEAARLLRPGGRLVFLTNSVLVSLCVPRGAAATPASTCCGRSATSDGCSGRGRRRVPSLARRLGAGAPGHGFVVEALHELYAPDDAETHGYYEIVTAEWARQWPVEELWVPLSFFAHPATDSTAEVTVPWKLSVPISSTRPSRSIAASRGRWPARSAG